MKGLKDKLRSTLDFYLSKLPDDESRDFMLELIVRDFRDFIRESAAKTHNTTKKP